MQYIIPRNRQIPDPSFEAILSFGPLVKVKAGGPEGSRFFAYRGKDPRLPKSALIPVGKLFPFKFGLICVSEDDRVLREFAADTLRACATVAMLSTAAAGALPLRFSTGVYPAIDQAVLPENRPAAQAAKVLDAELNRKGFTPQRGMAELLRRITPPDPDYRRVPELRDGVRALEEGAGSAPTAGASM